MDRSFLQDLIIFCASLSPEVMLRPTRVPELSPGAPENHAARVQGCSSGVSIMALPALRKEAAFSSPLGT